MAFQETPLANEHWPNYEIYGTLFAGRNGTEMDWFWVQMKAGRDGSGV